MSYGQRPEHDDELRRLEPLLDELSSQPMPWYRRLVALPCFVALVTMQVVQRRWDEWRSK